MTTFTDRHCVPCEGGIAALTEEQARLRMQEFPEWALDATAREMSRTFSFKDFHHTMAFVNAVAWIAHQEDHHPTLEVSYKRCTVRYATHAVHGLTENDLICAARIEALVAHAR